MNPSQEEPTNEEFLDGELTEEELNIIAAGLGAKVNANVGGSGALGNMNLGADLDSGGLFGR